MLLLITLVAHGFQLRLPWRLRRDAHPRHRLKELQWETTLLPELPALGAHNGTAADTP